MAADAVEKLAALKKTYAEIILNTTKESASRIVAAERKALRCQQSLVAAKEEAVSTVLRVKSIMDEKIQGAEKTLLDQERRIQELEEQLSDAVGTISHLRDELERANNKMMKKMCKEHENEDVPVSRPPFDITSANVSQAIRDDHLSQNVAEDGFSNDSFPDKGTVNPDLASIIMRSKEHELYRNGCTQRIRAFEHNVLNVKVPPEQTNMPLAVFQNEQVVPTGKKSQMPHTVGSLKMVKLENKEVNDSTKYGGVTLEESKSGYVPDIEFLRRICPRKPRTKYVQIKDNLVATCPQREKGQSKVKGMNKIPGKRSSNGDTDVTTSKMPVSEKTLNQDLNLHSGLVSVIECKIAEQEAVSLEENLGKGKSGLLQGSERSVSKQKGTKPKIRLLYSKSMPKNSPCCTKETVENGESNGNLISSIEEKHALTMDVKNDKQTVLSAGDSKLSPHRNTGENVDISDIRDDLPIKLPHAKNGTSSPAPVGKDKFLKFTFQRRKRESCSEKNEVTIPERLATRRKLEDKESVLVEPSNPSSTTEVPRDNRQITQVASQLTSLSEKQC